MLQASTGLRCWPREVSEANRGRDNTLKVNGQTLMVVDEAAMVGTDDLRHLLTAMTTAGSKTVLVGDTYKPARQILEVLRPAGEKQRASAQFDRPYDVLRYLNTGLNPNKYRPSDEVPRKSWTNT